MTYREIQEKLAGLSDWQLDQDAVFALEDAVHNISHLEIASSHIIKPDFDNIGDVDPTYELKERILGEVMGIESNSKSFDKNMEKITNFFTEQGFSHDFVPQDDILLRKGAPYFVY